LRRVFFIDRLTGKPGQKPRDGQGFFDGFNLFFASIRHVFAVMAVKRISIKVAKLDGSKNLPKYGDRATASFPRNSGKAVSSFRRRSRSMR
jgi:hypothetical protein